MFAARAMYNESGDMFDSYLHLAVRNAVIIESVEIVNEKRLKYTGHIINVRDARYSPKNYFAVALNFLMKTLLRFLAKALFCM